MKIKKTIWQEQCWCRCNLIHVTYSVYWSYIVLPLVYTLVFKNLFTLCIWTFYLHVYLSAQQKKSSDLMRQQLHNYKCCWTNMWLEIELKTSERACSAYCFWAISPPTTTVFLFFLNLLYLPFSSRLWLPPIFFFWVIYSKDKKNIEFFLIYCRHSLKYLCTWSHLP